jgi:hypothetical protein
MGMGHRYPQTCLGRVSGFLGFRTGPSAVRQRMGLSRADVSDHRDFSAERLHATDDLGVGEVVTRGVDECRGTAVPEGTPRPSTTPTAPGAPLRSRRRRTRAQRSRGPRALLIHAALTTRLRGPQLSGQSATIEVASTPPPPPPDARTQRSGPLRNCRVSA